MKQIDENLNNKRVLVGLSGGVDSATSALILKDMGYTVIGVTMAIYDGPITEGNRNGCYDCGEKDDIESAKAFCEANGMPYHVIDCTKEYKHIVLDYFRNEYLAGRTPNPCVRCNQFMKFGILPDFARNMGVEYDFFATGHYVRSQFSEKYQQKVLMRGLDYKKDQSYFLYRLKAEQIAKSIFPLGEMHKADVRKKAELLGLAMHDKPDSQDFYGGDKAELINAKPISGVVINKDGKVLGHHNGYWNYTPGQRKGLRIAASEALYVLHVNALRNEVVVGSRDECLKKGCIVNDLHFTVSNINLSSSYHARMRSSQELMPVQIEVVEGGEEMTVLFEDAQTGVAPGQSLVLYDGDIVVGGGVISSAL